MASDLSTRCRDALRRLHEQGRIASPWMAGMRWLERATPGMALVREGCGRVWDGDADRGIEPPWSAVPDSHDPATLGCLLALVREASGDPRAYSVPCELGRWKVVYRGWQPDNYDDEPAAMVAALEALAERGAQ